MGHYFTTALLYSCTSSLLYYCTTALLHYCTTALLHYCTTVLLIYCTTLLLYYCTTVLLHYYYRTAGLICNTGTAAPGERFHIGQYIRPEQCLLPYIWKICYPKFVGYKSTTFGYWN